MTDPLRSPVADRMLAALPVGEHEDFDLTGLDRVGLPVRAASSYPAPVAPDGVVDSPAGGIGYGADPLAARLSALGEMTESAQLSRHVRRTSPATASTAEMRRRHGDGAVVDPVALPVDAGADVADDRPLRWLPARRWRDGALAEQVWLPAEVVAASGDDVPGGPPAGGWLVTPITNGLGAGQSLPWAVGHGLLELLQRDGNGLRFRALDVGDVVDLGPGREQLTDPVSRRALQMFDAAGVEVVVKLASLDLGVVNAYAVGAEAAGGPEPVHPLVVTAAGEGTHPDREVAVRKALLELAASRVRKVFTHGPVEAVDALAPPGYRQRWEAHHPSAGEERTLRAMQEWLRLDADELIDAARMDGAGHVGTFTSVALPLSGPLVAVLVIFTFMRRWNEFVWPLIVLTSADSYTLPVGLQFRVQQFGSDYGPLLAMSFLSILPMLLVFAVFQRFFVEGVARSGPR